MRTLAKPPKAKQSHTPQVEVDKKEQKQQPSKKITKTIFHSPFRYKMYSSNDPAKHSASKMQTQS